jgi:precorrin-6A/cobalt-precorrin-6A reductase
MRVLILGGTAEARALAAALHARGDHVLTSLAGAVPDPRRPEGETRIGPLDAPEDLNRLAAGYDVVVDATHPFATRVSALAARAGVPLLRLERPPWRERPGDRWTRVADAQAAARAIPGDARVLLTTGRRDLAAFAESTAFFVIRAITAPDPPLPPRRELLLDRGPYTVAGERALLDRHAIDLIVTKDSGGDATEAKLAAARERGLPVIVIDRPPAPPGVPTRPTVDEMLSLLSGDLAGALRRERAGRPSKAAGWP